MTGYTDDACDLCSLPAQACVALPAGPLTLADGSVLREARDWFLCPRCAAEVYHGQRGPLVMRLAEIWSMRFPEIADGASSWGELAVVTDALIHARVGPIEVVRPPTIPDDAPPVVREGLARQAIMLAGGGCPCGGRTSVPPRRERRRLEKAGDPVIGVIRHRGGCPANPRVLAAELITWASFA